MGSSTKDLGVVVRRQERGEGCLIARAQRRCFDIDSMCEIQGRFVVNIVHSQLVRGEGGVIRNRFGDLPSCSRSCWQQVFCMVNYIVSFRMCTYYKYKPDQDDDSRIVDLVS